MEVELLQFSVKLMQDLALPELDRIHLFISLQDNFYHPGQDDLEPLLFLLHS